MLTLAKILSRQVQMRASCTDQHMFSSSYSTPVAAGQISNTGPKTVDGIEKVRLVGRLLQQLRRLRCIHVLRIVNY